MTTEEKQEIRQAMLHFSNIMETRIKLNLMVAKRVTFLLRFSFIGFGIVAVGGFATLLLMHHQLPDIRKATGHINDHFMTMNNNMYFIRHSMMAMDHSVAYLPAITQDMQGIHRSVDAISRDMTTMSRGVSILNYDIAQLSVAVATINSSFYIMNYQVGRMSVDVDHLSAPARMFNRFNPFK